MPIYPNYSDTVWISVYNNISEIIIRPEQQGDIPEIQALIRRAFEQSAFGLQGEDLLVDRLRQSESFIPQLSLVALQQDQSDPTRSTVVGHILLTRIVLRESNHDTSALALAPMSVLPEYQRQGIGGQLIIKAHDIAAQFDHCCIALLGHETYYPRFGYVPAHDYNVHFPFDIPRQNCMLFVLQEGKMVFKDAKVIYPIEFQQDT